MPLIPFLRQWCSTAIECDLDKSSRHEWVLVEEGDGFESKWSQLDYFLKSDLSKDTWHEYLNPAITRLPVKSLDPCWLNSLELSQAYSAYVALSAENKETFLLGCEWFNKAITARSSTEQFLLMIIMLEVFLPKENTKCDACGQVSYGVNQKFKSYIPDIMGKDWTPDFAKVLGNLYSLRSEIAHNGVSMKQQSVGLNPAEIRERGHLEYLLQLCRQFLVSWLLRKQETLC